MGFIAPEADAFVVAWGLEMGKTRFGQAVQAGDDYRTSNLRIFAAGDARRGQSLVVWAIAEGREAARAIDHAHMGRTELPARDTQGYEALGVDVKHV
jgi:glutamate synthase (NADPH/NADH) small chain